MTVPSNPLPVRVKQLIAISSWSCWYWSLPVMDAWLVSSFRQRIIMTGADGIVMTGADGIVMTGADGLMYATANGIVMTGADRHR